MSLDPKKISIVFLFIFGLIVIALLGGAGSYISEFMRNVSESEVSEYVYVFVIVSICSLTSLAGYFLAKKKNKKNPLKWAKTCFFWSFLGLIFLLLDDEE